MKKNRILKMVVLTFAFMVSFCVFGVEGINSSIDGNEVYAATTKDTRTGVYKAAYNQGGKITNEWCYLKNGKVQYNYNGFAKNDNGWWYIEKGKVTFKKNDVIKGTVNNQSGWWFVKGSKVQFVDSVEKNSNGWWCIQKGKVNFGFTGLAKNNNGYWYCKNGKVNFGFKGIASNNNGEWYCSGGKVDFSYNGNYKYNGIQYNVKGGKATKAATVTPGGNVVDGGSNYVLNTNSMKFHRPSCRWANQISSKNRATSSKSRDEIIKAGYNPCKDCDP